MNSEKKRIVFLDLCRIFAVVSVFIGHKFYGDLNLITANPSNHIIFRDIIDFLKPFCHGGGFGVLVFYLLYWNRFKITLPSWAIILSELTYGLYLFHNWLFEYFCKTLPKSDFPRIFSLIALALFCYALHRLIEKPGILLGRALIIRLNKIPSKS